MAQFNTILTARIEFVESHHSSSTHYQSFDKTSCFFSLELTRIVNGLGRPRKHFYLDDDDMSWGKEDLRREEIPWTHKTKESWPQQNAHPCKQQATATVYLLPYLLCSPPLHFLPKSLQPLASHFRKQCQEGTGVHTKGPQLDLLLRRDPALCAKLSHLAHTQVQIAKSL